MDSYNYINLLPGNGTGNDPIATAVWNDFSFDDNDITPELANPTYVSCFLHDLGCEIFHTYSGSKDLADYVDFSHEFVDGEEMVLL